MVLLSHFPDERASYRDPSRGLPFRLGFPVATEDLLLVIDSNIVDLLPVCVDTRGREGQGLAVRRSYSGHCLHHFPRLCSGELGCGVVDSLLGACVVVGHPRYGVGLPIVEDHTKIHLRWIPLRVNTLTSGPDILSDRFHNQGVAFRRWARVIC